MTLEKAILKTKELFGEDSFTEYDDQEDKIRYYVGACPKSPGVYQGFMGFSWQEALDHAKLK